MIEAEKCTLSEGGFEAYRFPGNIFRFEEICFGYCFQEFLGDGSQSMPLMNCPVAAFAKKHGYGHLMPLFCGSDFKVAERYGMRLIRRHTEAEGFPDCDFWYLMENDAER